MQRSLSNRSSLDGAGGTARWAWPRSRCEGLTVIEVMIVVVLLGVLVALAAPNLGDLFINNRLSAATNDLLVALNSTRNEAMRRGEVVTMRRCATDDSVCPQRSSKVEDWGSGWYIFVDPDRNRLRGVDEELVRVGHALSPPLTLFRRVYTAGSALKNVADAVSFCPDGRVFTDGDCAKRASAGEGSMIFVLCYGGKLALDGRSRSRVVLVNREGRVRLAPQDGAARPLNESGNVVTGVGGGDPCVTPRYWG